MPLSKTHFTDFAVVFLILFSKIVRLLCTVYLVMLSPMRGGKLSIAIYALMRESNDCEGWFLLNNWDLFKSRLDRLFLDFFLQLRGLWNRLAESFTSRMASISFLWAAVMFSESLLWGRSSLYEGFWVQFQVISADRRLESWRRFFSIWEILHC